MASKTQKTRKKNTEKHSAKKNSAATHRHEGVDKALNENVAQHVYRVPTSRQLLREMLALWRSWWRPLLAISGIYGAFYFVVVRGVTVFDVETISLLIEETFGTELNSVGRTIILTGAIFGLSSELDQVSSLLTSFLFVINSLALVWVLRHIWLNKRVSIRDSYYQGMYPLIPFMIILGIMFLQLIPFTLGGYIMSTIFANGIAVTVFEKLLVVAFFIFMMLVTGYLLTGSFMAMYMVTIPDMTPMRALRSAKEVLKQRRLLAMQRILVFAIMSILVAFALLLLTVFVFPPLAPIMVIALSVIALPWGHSFLFILYRHIIED